jgi:hypothetical protein
MTLRVMSAGGNQRKAPAHVRSYPNCYHNGLRQQNDATCQERTHAAQQNNILFDDLVSGGEQRRRYGESKYTGRLGIDNEFELSRLCHRQVRRLRTP